MLTMIQGVCRRVGHPPPTVVATATDTTTLRLLELANDEGRDLAEYGDWRVLRKEHTFSTAAAETQTGTPIPTDWNGFIDGTFWNRTRQLPLYGPVDSQTWQLWKAQGTSPTTDAFYLRGTSWLWAPVPTAGQTIAYEYRTKNWCSSSGGTGQAAWAADSDLAVLDETLMALGTAWRFKKSRGLDWQSDYDEYKHRVDTRLAKDQPRRIIDMKEGSGPGQIPGVVVPDMNWTL